MRVVVDTNVWVSAFLAQRGYPARLIEAFRQALIEVVVSEPLIRELDAVLRRPRLVSKYQLSDQSINEYISLIKRQSVWVSVSGTLHICRDPRDDFLLETALFGGAEYLVTRDDDLKRDLDLTQRMAEWGVQVVSVQQFLNLLHHE
jgi:putative PIN family toxin of toxin-antitoxin system